MSDIVPLFGGVLLYVVESGQHECGSDEYADFRADEFLVLRFTRWACYEIGVCCCEVWEAISEVLRVYTFEVLDFEVLRRILTNCCPSSAI